MILYIASHILLFFGLGCAIPAPICLQVAMTFLPELQTERRRDDLHNLMGMLVVAGITMAMVGGMILAGRSHP
jgi:hypothetical protein